MQLHAYQKNSESLLLALSDVQKYLNEFKALFPQVLQIFFKFYDEQLTQSMVYNSFRQILKLIFDADQFCLFTLEPTIATLFWSSTGQYTEIKESMSQQSYSDFTFQLTKIKSGLIYDLEKMELELFSELSQANKYQKSLIYKIRIEKQKQIVVVLQYNEKNSSHIFSNLLENPVQFQQIQKPFEDLFSFIREEIKLEKLNNYSPIVVILHMLNCTWKIISRSDLTFYELVRASLQQKLACDVELLKLNSIEEVQHQTSKQLLFFIKSNGKYFYYYTQLPLLLPQRDFAYSESLIQTCYTRFQKSIVKWTEKLALYKYVLKQTTKIFVDFDKNGDMIFTNQPLSNFYKTNFKVQINQRHYQQLFKNEKKFLEELQIFIDRKDSSKTNQFRTFRTRPEVDVYIRSSNNKFKGMYMLFNEFDLTDKLSMSTSFLDNKSISNEYSSDLGKSLASIDEVEELSPEAKSKVQSKLRKVVNFQETIKFIKSLTKDNEVQDSQI